MKPKQKQPAQRSAKKQIHLVIPEKKPTSAAAPAPAPVEASSAKPGIAAQVADQLGETKHWPRKQIRRICWALGNEQALALAQRALDIEAVGGMLIKNGKRRRTVGGVFFYLAYTEGEPREGCELVRPEWKPGRKKKTVQSEQVENVQGQSEGDR